MMMALNKWNQQKIYSEILVAKFYITLKLMEILFRYFGIIYGTYLIMAELNFIQCVKPKLLVLLLILMIFFIILIHCILALNSSSNYLMVMEKLEENLECVTLSLILR
jgi:hypothetical protein